MSKKSIAITVAVVIGVLAIPAAVWGVNVATAGIKGQGDAHVVKSSASNWTAAQARFEELYADIEATDRKITVAAEQKAADPEDKTAADTYLGTVNYCLSVVGEYNAEARKYLAEEFRAADLPAQIDNHDPATDCKE
ncbi:membrane protein [Microbacterium phage Caron]|uniref:Membrane protein n=1 Tax=Microbacterium phage Caron TaxID=3028494 RepID=A0AAE9ZK11_9CAUD|nr:membrane protein [Microbacterium phage Caron]